MPDYSGLRSGSDTWLTRGNAEETLGRLVAALAEGKPGIVQREATTAELTLGSRPMWRSFGLFTPRRLRPIRVRLSVTQNGPDECQVSVETENNEGFYLYAFPGHASLFRGAFAWLFGVLRGAAPEISTDR